MKELDDQARLNTQTFYEVFKYEPDTNITNFKILEQMREERKNMTPEEYQKSYRDNKDKIKGQIVEFPYRYCEEENLLNNFLRFEAMFPEVMYT